MNPPKKNKKYSNLGGYKPGKNPHQPENNIPPPNEEELVIEYVPMNYYPPMYPNTSPVLMPLYYPNYGEPHQQYPPEQVHHYMHQYPPDQQHYILPYPPEQPLPPAHPQQQPHPQQQHPYLQPQPQPQPQQQPEEQPEELSEEKPTAQIKIMKNVKTLRANRSRKEWKNDIDNISDLLMLSKAVEHTNFTNISLNQSHLINLQEPLDKLINLVGMESIKKNIFNQLIFFLQNIEPQYPHMLHTCIEGPPGCGKTELANILAEIYANLGIIEEPKVVVARRSDLVAGFLGQTARKTQDVIDSAKGGVLLIDEAYSLGNEEKKDSFAKECIDTLNQNLTEGKGDFICIIAGYKEDLEKSFFGFNSGLERRFPYRFAVEQYDAAQLCQIYQTILTRNDWKLDENIEKNLEEFFKEKREDFKFNGGDLENLVHFSKLAYAKNRIFNKKNDKIIMLEDVKKAYDMFMSNKKKELELKGAPSHMYL